jgi:hypothetical protein
MHPLIQQQLAADHVNDMIAAAAGSRRARQARRTRRSRTSRQERSSACRAARPSSSQQLRLHLVAWGAAGHSSPSAASAGTPGPNSRCRPQRRFLPSSPSYPQPRTGGAPCAHTSPHARRLTARTATPPTRWPFTPGKGGACCATGWSCSTTWVRSCPAPGAPPAPPGPRPASRRGVRNARGRSRCARSGPQPPATSCPCRPEDSTRIGTFG